MKRKIPKVFGVVLLLFFGQYSFAQITPATLQQIKLLLTEKNSRTPAQQKIDSHLLQAVRENRGQAMVQGVNLVPANVNADASGILNVDIKATITDAFLAKITALGGKIIYASPTYHTVRASLSLTAVETVAGYAEVSFIEQAVRPMLVDQNLDRFKKDTAFMARVANVRARLTAYLNAMQPLTGKVTSQGDVTHRAAVVRSTYGFQGQGIKIGVLSDSYNSLQGAATDVTNGDLPGIGNPDGNTTPVTVVADYINPYSTDEGRAMLQVIYDLAPKATLYFATADVSEANFAANIISLRSTYNCNIILDDVAYFDEPAFQDGIAAQAVNTVTAAGALYFSAAGNSGALAKGTSGVFEGDFNDAGSLAFAPGDSKTGTVYNFGTVSAPVNGDIITSQGEAYNLSWSDPWGASANDYDLFVVSASGTIKTSSTNVQNGSQNPYEVIYANSFTWASGDRLVVFKASGAAVRAIHLNTNRGTLAVATAGQTSGHACAANAFCMAATPATTAFEPGYPSGPYPSAFVSTNKVEPFSSDGPRRIFYTPTGTPIVAGNVLFGTNGGTLLAKPDLTAADGVSTSVTNSTEFTSSSLFFGTSCAAPHAGAIAALILSASPTLTAAQVRTILTSTALDIEGTGYDYNSGSGIIQAFQAVQLVVAPPPAVPVVTVPTCISHTATSANFTITNYVAGLTYTLTYTGTGTNVDFLSHTTTYTPNSSGVITVPIQSGTAAGVTGTYSIVAKSSQGTLSSPASFSVSTTPASIAVTGTMSCLDPYGYTILTASPALCATCTYTWAIPSGSGTGIIQSTGSNTARFAINSAATSATVTASYCSITSPVVTLTQQPPRPTLDKATYCVTGNNTVDITITNYPGTGTYRIAYMNVGQAGYSDFLVDGSYTPNAAGKISIPLNSTATNASTGYYQLFYTGVCGEETGTDVIASFTAGTTPATVPVTGVTTCLNPYGYTILTAPTALCATCSYTWAITSGSGTIAAASSNTAKFAISSSSPSATVAATYVVGAGCSIASSPVVITQEPPGPVLDKSSYCAAPNGTSGNAITMKVTNYPGTGTYTVQYISIGSPSYTDMLVDGTYTPTSTGVITVPVNPTATASSQGYYQVFYTGVCGEETGANDVPMVGAGNTLTAAPTIAGTTTCQSVYGYTTLTASPACSTCYTWAIPSGGGHFTGGSATATTNPVNYSTAGTTATITATYVGGLGCGVTSAPLTITPAPAAPIVSPAPTYHPGATTVAINISNYTSGSFTLGYINIGSPSYTDFLVDGTYNAVSGVLTVPIKTTAAPGAEGVYQLTYNGACGPVTLGTFTVSGSASRPELVQETAAYTVYPNPNNGTFTINIPVVNNKAAGALYDANGKAIREIQLVQGVNTINATDVVAGIYYLTIDLDGNSSSTKIVIQK